MKDFKWR